MRRVFRRPVFTLSSFFSGLGRTAWQLPVFVRASRQPSTSVQLHRQVMLAVTSVTGCRYSTAILTRLAGNDGLDLRDLQALLDQRGGQQDDATAAAILFAQHFAGRQAKPSSAYQERLEAYFTPAQRHELLAVISAIYFANLCGNSADALSARLRGFRIEDGHLLAEILATLLCWPVLLAVHIAALSGAITLGSPD